MMITKDDVQPVYDRVFEVAAGIIKRGGQHAPIFARLGRNPDRALGYFDLMMLTLESDEQKELVGKFLRMQRADCGPDEAIMFITEAWTLTVPADGKANLNTPVKDQPGARECVHFAFSGPGFQYEASCIISRDPNALEKAELLDIKESYGRMGITGRALPR